MMNPLTHEEITEMLAGIDILFTDLDAMEATIERIEAYNAEYQKEVAAREAQEKLNAEYIAVVEGREPAA